MHWPKPLLNPHDKSLWRRILFVLAGFAVLTYCYSSYQNSYYALASRPQVDVKTQPSVNLVVASIKNDDTSWINVHFPHYESTIYISDDPSAKYTVPKNQGREATAFLTYIIDHYDHLPDIAIFLHGKRYQWHNEDPLYDGVPVLKQLQLSYVQRHGFATLRCSWEYGCPNELNPNTTMSDDEVSAILASPREGDGSVDDRGKTEAAYVRAYRELFGSQRPLPDKVAVHCGAQFAVTREAIRSRAKQEYIHFRDWLWSTTLSDDLSGRCLEYSWHIIFGKESVLCPDAAVCFCEKFGLCNLSNCKEWGCEKRYWVKYGVLPAGWPDFGTGEDGWPPRHWAD